jgi:Fe-S cluster assembly protein SufD
MGLLQVHQAARSRFATHSISTGGRLVRHDVRARLEGEGADAILNGLYVVEGEQVVDTHMLVEHMAPHCTSLELYKGILDGRSRGVFNGRIFVAPDAQATDAVQSNRNVLLSREALVNSNPQLEIFANDVRCTHGSTVGQLDRDAVFYLRSRGISLPAAKSILVWAFAAEIVDGIRDTEVRARLSDFLFARLPGGEVVRQAV